MENNMVLFNKSTDEKLNAALEFRNTILANYQKKPKRIENFKHPFELSDFSPANPSIGEIEMINKFFYKNIKLVFIYLVYFTFGFGYCIHRTYKFAKFNIPLRKSLYSWGFLFLTLPVYSKIIEGASSSKLNVIIEDVYLSYLADTEVNQNKVEYKKLLRNKMDMYKKFIDISKKLY